MVDAYFTSLHVPAITVSVIRGPELVWSHAAKAKHSKKLKSRVRIDNLYPI